MVMANSQLWWAQSLRVHITSDTFDVLLADRPYDWMRALNHARAEISWWSGSYFDPEVVEVFLKIPNDVGCGCILRKEPAPKTQSGIRDAPNGVPGEPLAPFY